MVILVVLTEHDGVALEPGPLVRARAVGKWHSFLFAPPVFFGSDPASGKRDEPSNAYSSPVTYRKHDKAPAACSGARVRSPPAGAPRVRHADEGDVDLRPRERPVRRHARVRGEHLAESTSEVRT